MSTTKTPYNDQLVFINDIATKIKGGVRKLACQLPTGGGKTVVFSNICQRFRARYGTSILIFVHREELMDQTRRTLHDWYGINAVPIVAGMKYIPPAEVYVGMVESTFKRLHKITNIGLVIIDEAHIGVFNKLHEEFKTAVHLGFTATPITASKKKPMKMFYEDIVCGLSIEELIKKGRLCQNVTYAPKDVVKRAELKMKGSDFDEQQMSSVFSKVKYVHNTIRAYERWGKGVKTVVFNVNTTHNKIVCDAFIAAGYNAKALDSVNTPKEERREVMKWFRSTPDAILCNVGIATLGFDEPDIECVLVNRATASLSLWLQMGGRGGRITPYKHLFTIIDMGGNAITHGDWCQRRDWYDLFWNPGKPGKGGVPPYKECVECDAIIFAGVRVCPVCGAVQPHGVVPMEVEMSEFVQVTKEIDVRVLAEQHAHKKQYYPFFLLSRIVAESVKKTTPRITDEIAIFTLEVFHKLAREWAHTANKKYLSWMREKAPTLLYNELKIRYPDWDTKLISNDDKRDKSVRQTELYKVDEEDSSGLIL
jgi:superfamily II DNA or RNA helicase